MLWLPVASADVVNVACATPDTTVSEPVPSVVVPSRNVTVPDGVPAPGATGATFAVNVTAWPGADGDGAAVTVVEGDAGDTARVSAGDDEPDHEPDAPYTAAIAWSPTASADVVSAAWPEPSSGVEPSDDEPS